MRKLKLLLAVAALAGLVFAGQSVNRLGSDASVTTQPHAGVRATIVPAANTCAGYQLHPDHYRADVTGSRHRK
ncbi:MAG TPA: hypothetical protein VLA19_33625 [Herpetosiphonaceae bacterium]|nr:hypothetical protein [Herpetosiphonaceae bacterium]